jgi:F-type H+-transporting ATPase subunit a
MEHPYLFLPKVFELFGLGHFAQAYPHVVYSWLVLLVLILLAYFGTRRITLVPGKAQNFFEVVISGMEEFMVTSPEGGRWFFPLVGTIFLYIVTCNLIGLIPGFFPPTASINTTLSCALVSFTFTHFVGVKYHGVKYIKHFLGPIWWMIPIIFPIELIGHLARIMSLSFRLFGNMMGHELVLMILFMLPAPLYCPSWRWAFVSLFRHSLLLSIMYSAAPEHAH